MVASQPPGQGRVAALVFEQRPPTLRPVCGEEPLGKISQRDSPASDKRFPPGQARLGHTCQSISRELRFLCFLPALNRGWRSNMLSFATSRLVAAGRAARTWVRPKCGLWCSPLSIDWKAVIATSTAGVKPNVLPGLALQAIALASVLTYYMVPGARPAFAVVANWKVRYGFAYSACATALFGGAIPFLYLLASGHIRIGQRRAQFLFCLLFWGYRGVEVDLFYRLQAFVFGDRAALAVVLPKVLVDQLVYSVFVAAPGQALFFLWKERGFSFRAIRPDLNLSYLTTAVATVSFSSWMVWIPAVSITYCLPSPLQIPLYNVVVFLGVVVDLRQSTLGRRSQGIGDVTSSRPEIISWDDVAPDNILTYPRFVMQPT